MYSTHIRKNRKDLTFSSLLRYNFTLRFLGGKDEAYICGASKEVAGVLIPVNLTPIFSSIQPFTKLFYNVLTAIRCL